MKPDEKYMNNKTNTSDTDLNLVPFKGGGNPFSMSSAGWIPVYFFGNSSFDNSIASSMGLPSPTSSQIPTSNMNTNSQGFNNMQGYNNTPGYIDTQNYNNMQNPNNAQVYGNTQNYNNTQSPGNMQGYGTNQNPNTMQSYGTTQGSNNMPSFSGTQNPNNIQDYNNPNAFPDESSGENLYSYNNPSSNTTSNNSTVSSTDRNKPNILNILRDLNIDLDEDNDLVRHCSDKRIDKIYNKIEKNNPEIMGVLDTYEVPCPIAKVLIRKIIKVTLNHCKRDGD